MMTKMSRSLIVKLRSCMTTELPYAMVRSLTVILGRVLPRSSDAEDIGDARDDRGRDHDADDSGDHGRGSGFADRGGAAPAADAAQTSGQRHQHPEHGAHEEAEQQIVASDGVISLQQVLQ